MDDARLLLEFRRHGSQAAFGRIMERHYALVLAVCLRELGDRSMAEDAAQAVFLLLSRKAGSIRAAGSLAGWLFQAARWVCKDVSKQERRRLEKEREIQAEMQIEPMEKRWSELEPAINDAVAALGASDRDAVLLRFFEGMSLAQTGAALGITEAAAKMRISRAIAKLRAYFSRRDVAMEASLFVSLLTTHACAVNDAPISARFTPSPHALNLTKGILRKMALTKLKIAAAIVLIGTASAATFSKNTSASNSALPVISLPRIDMSPPHRSANAAPVRPGGKGVVTGRAVYADGKPAGGIKVVAQMQEKNIEKLPPEKYGASWAESVTAPDGRYRLSGLTNASYNVTVHDTNQPEWLTAAAEGVTADDGKTVLAPDLIVTHGSFVTGVMTDTRTGAPVANGWVGCYGPATPSSSAMILNAMTDNTGHYRLRVVPGQNRVYTGVGGHFTSVTVDVPESGAANADLTIDAAAAMAEINAANARAKLEQR